MCVVSNVMDTYRPFIPDPYTWPQQPVNPTPPSTVIYRPDNDRVEAIEKQIQEMKELIESFHKAVEAAEVFDRLTGQPDCVDPEKAVLIDQVAQLEAKIKKLENPHLITFHVEYDVDIDANEFAADCGLDFNDSDSQRAAVIAYVQEYAESTDGYLIDNYVATVVE